jgi:hypothetical protein
VNGEAVDAWVSSVDELLAGRRDDVEVSDDAMRWSPEAPETGPLLPAAMWDDCVWPPPGQWQPTGLLNRSDIHVDPTVIDRLTRTFAMSVAEVTGTVIRTLVAFEQIPDELVEVDDAGNRIRRALEARRNRDTGPPRPPLGRRVR